MTRRRRSLSRTQLRVLDRLARATEDGLVLATDEVVGWPRALRSMPLQTLRSLERRRYVRAVDVTEHPYLWRVTLGGLVVARAWRGRLPDVGGDS